MSLPYETERYNLSQAKIEGRHKAQVDLFYQHYRRIYEANPDQMGQDFLNLYSMSIDLMDQCDPPLGYGVTINLGNVKPREDREAEDMQEYLEQYVFPFEKRLAKKYSITNYTFSLEVAPKTGRYHIHGWLQKAETRSRVYPSEIQQQIWNSLPDTVLKRKANIEHICVKPIYNKKGWDKYCSKEPLYTFGKITDLPEIKKKKNKNKTIL